jgi:iron complex outermembrane recepter protein
MEQRAIFSFRRSQNFIGVRRVALLLAGATALFIATPSLRSQQPAKDLSSVSLEDLMNIQVTSASKKEQKISQVAAAIFVITQDDIRASGAVNIPDLLRMVPGLDVAQINANTWAISSRGFNSQYANKLLVLVDGRAVYTPLVGGVSWETLDVPVEDIDRIEVIRGPAGTIWGANAVNGVINIVTKKANDTLGGLLTTGGGTEYQGFGTAQYASKINDDAALRLFAKYLNDGEFPNLNGQNGRDGWNLLHGGFRADASASEKDSFTLQGDIYTGEEGATIDHADAEASQNIVKTNIAGLSGGNLLGRWNHAFSNASDTTLQIYFDRYTRSGPESYEARNTFDFDFQHHFAASPRHDLIWGADFRHSPDHTEGTIDQSFVPADRTFDLFSFFVQDEIALKPGRLVLTLGTKFEQDNFAGFHVEPAGRLSWTPCPHQTLWFAVSTADRTPSRRDLNLVSVLAALPGPAEDLLMGNPDLQPEHVIANEAGFRTKANDRLSFDLAIFLNYYSSLQTIEALPPYVLPSDPPLTVYPSTFNNETNGITAGIEVFANWKATRHWTLSPGYSFLKIDLNVAPDTTADSQGSDPTHQAQLRSHYEFSRALAWDVNAYYVSRLGNQPVPSYTRLDSQLTWRFGEKSQFAAVGQNLLRDHHVEYDGFLQVVNSDEVKRSAYVKLTWWF